MKKENPNIWEKRKDCGNMKKYPAKRLVSLLLAALLAFPATAALAAGPAGENIEVFASGETGSGGGADLTNTEDSPFDPVKFADPKQGVTSAQLVIYAYDVDAPDEIDEVFLNGHSVGILTGMDEEWNTSVLEVTGDALKSLCDGQENSIAVKTNSGWIVFVRTITLVVNGGSAGGQFDRGSSTVTATLNGQEIVTSVSVTSVSGGTFGVEYAVKELDSEGNQVRQVASKSEPSVSFAAGTVHREEETFSLPEAPKPGTAYRVDYVIKDSLQIPVFTLSAVVGSTVEAGVAVESGEVAADAISVQGLKGAAAALASLTEGNATSVTLTVREGKEAADYGDILTRAEGDGHAVGLALELTVDKEVRDAAGRLVAGESGPVAQLDRPIQISIQLPAPLQGKTGYAVYRSHQGKVDVLTETANSEGERIALSADGSALTLTVGKFSTCAITYQGEKGGTPAEPGRLDDEPNTGAPAQPAGWAVGLGTLSVGAFLFWKLRRGAGPAR